MTVLRIALAALAVIAVAWFAVLLSDVRDANRAAASKGTIAAVERVLKGPRAEFDARVAELRAAQRLNPDTSIALDIAGAYLVRGGAANLRFARRTVAGVLAAEPDNLQAWAALFRIARAQGDVRAQRSALAHARRLDPIDFRSS